MERKLVMSFKDEVTEVEIEGIMDSVLATGAVVSKNGALVEKLGAVIVETTETEYDVQ